jgi:hypothetical protein
MRSVSASPPSPAITAKARLWRDGAALPFDEGCCNLVEIDVTTPLAVKLVSKMALLGLRDTGPVVRAHVTTEGV